ncbi:MAG: hypothetical protein K6T88_16155 [Bacillus sp. (in: Bacteria)]|nr:hypothetical protein [Bacillus sp. (in: firmicutes)]
MKKKGNKNKENHNDQWKFYHRNFPTLKEENLHLSYYQNLYHKTSINIQRSARTASRLRSSPFNKSPPESNRSSLFPLS